MRDGKGPSREHSFSFAAPRRADERETERSSAPAPAEVVDAKFAQAARTLASITEDGLAQLEAALPAAADRRSPLDCRRAYDIARAGIERSLQAAESAKEFAVAHGKRHGIATAARLAEYQAKLQGTRAQLAAAPGPPPAFARVASEAEILTAIRMRPGRDRNTELAVRFSSLDRAQARTLYGRLADRADPEDELATAFRGVVDAREHLLGILAGTKQLRVDPRAFGRSRRGAAPAAASGAAPAMAGIAPAARGPASVVHDSPASMSASVADAGAAGDGSASVSASVANVAAAHDSSASMPASVADAGAAGDSPASMSASVADAGAAGDSSASMSASVAEVAAAHDGSTMMPASVADIGARRGSPDVPSVQRKATAAAIAPDPGLAARRGFEGAGAPVPHRERIQASFGRHDVSDVRTYQGPAARTAADQLGAAAYTVGRQIAFAQAPDLRIASHEAAHAVQQRIGVQLLGGLDGGANDAYERHADEVADAVVAGRSAEPLLDRVPGQMSGGVALADASRGAAVQRSPRPAVEAHADHAEPTDHADRDASVPGRGSYLVEQTGAGSYVFVFNTFDRNGWSEPVLTGLRYYMHQVFPAVGDAVIRTVFSELKVHFQGAGTAAFPVDRRYELTVDPKFHERVLAWMSAHHPELAPNAPRTGHGALRPVDAGAVEPSRTARTDANHGAPRHATTLAGDAAHGARAGDARVTRDSGIKDGALSGAAGESDGDAHGWHRWIPRGELRLQPAQPTYVAGATIETELAWDLSVHPDAGQILLPHHCTYAWTVHRGGKLVDSTGRSILADDRRARLRLGDAPGRYEITVTATSRHFQTTRHRFSSHVVVTAVSEQAFDRAAFDAQLAGPDAAFARDAHGALQVRPGQTARTPQDEIGNLDLTRGGIAALAAQDRITAGDRDVATAQLDKQRAALVDVQAEVAGGAPYIVRGTFVSREDSSTLPLRVLMHGFRRHALGGIARYDVVLHDTTFGDAVQHPASAAGRLDHDTPGAVYGALETEALANMAEHLHAHNDYPRGTIHLAAQRLAGDAVWETTLDTDNGRKTAKKILGAAGLIGGAALLIVPGGSVVSAGLLVVTSAAGVASVALEVEDRIAKEGQLKLDRRLAMDVLQVAATALPFGTLSKTFAGASELAKGRFLLCMTGLDVAQGFVIAADVKHQLSVVEASAAVQLASATSEDQRTAIHAQRDRQVAEILGGAVVNGGFLLVSLGGGIKHAVAVGHDGVVFTVRDPVLDLAKQGRAQIEHALSTDTFEHEGRRVPLTPQERSYRQHEVAAQPPAPRGEPAGSAARMDDMAHSNQGHRAHDAAVAGAHDAAAGHTASAVRPAGPIEAAPGRQQADRDLARIRAGTPGKIRSAAELGSEDVARAMNAQLQPIQIADVHAIIDAFPPAEQPQARIVLARASGFGRMEGLNPLEEALRPHLAEGGALFTPGQGSLADNVAYCSSKGLFPAQRGGIATTTRILPRTVVIVDDVVLSMIKSDPAFAQSLHQQRAVLIEPRGFTEGINLFNAASPERIRQRTQHVLDRAKALVASSHGELSFDDAVTAALDGTTHEALGAAGLTGQLQVVDPARHAATGDEDIAEQVNGGAGITAGQLDAVLARVEESDRLLLRELLAQQAEVFSPRRIANDLLAMHQHHLELAAQHYVKPEDIYYYIFIPNKSYGMMAMAHRQATGTPVDHYINGAAELESRHLGPNTMLVILDDVAGSGMSLSDASSDASRSGYPGHVVVSPMISTMQAERLFNGPEGIASQSSNTSYAPQKVMGALGESAMFRALPPDRQERLKKVLRSLQFSKNGTSVAFPYMAPDNNNTWFADLLAKEFILNKSRAASKSYGEWQPPEPDQEAP